MDRRTSHNGFEIKIDLNGVTISQKGGSFSFSANDRDKLTDLLASVNSIGSALGALPHLQSTPYRVLILDGGKNLKLIKQGMTHGGLSFEPGQTDDLITAIQTGFDVFIDNEKLRGGPARPGPTGFDTPEPPIDGQV